MNILLKLAYLFFVGSVLGWCIEVIFRRFFSAANPERKWINPGFCTGPYLPLYGSGLCILYLVASLEERPLLADPVGNKILVIVLMAVLMTLIEYISGMLSLKINKVRLWDYTNQWGNIEGVICPKFSLIWGLCGASYDFLIHPYIKNSLVWLSENLAFSFFIGVFFGVFIIDVAHSLQVVTKLKHFADENDVILRYEHIKAQIRRSHEQRAEKYHFFRPFSSSRPLPELLRELRDSLEQRKKK